MTPRDHIATARRQLEGADRRIVEGKTRDARGVLSGAIAELAKAQHELAFRDGYEAAQADARAQADLDQHVRVMRGRDAIEAVLETWGWDDAAATERANNLAQAFAGALPPPRGDIVGDVAAGVRVRLPAHVACLAPHERAQVLLGVTTAVVTAWVCAERESEAAGGAAPERSTSAAPSEIPPTPVAPTTADLERLGALCTRAAHAGDTHGAAR